MKHYDEGGFSSSNEWYMVMSVEQNRRTTNMQLAYLAWALWIVCWFFSDRGMGSSTLVPVQH